MTENTHSDDALLKQWLATRSEAAFRTLVGRYAGLVHMAALRTCGDASLAAEAAQNTFITLAEKAGTLASRKSLAGWLHLTAVMQAKNLHRKQLRDTRKIERFHMQMDDPTPKKAAIDWGRLSPLLDEALSTLPAQDREALLLRFYRSLSIQEVATTLGIAHAAAQKRVNRATERIRRIFERKGVQTSGSLSAVMAAGFKTDAQAASALIDTLAHKALAASAASTTATLTTATIIILMKKKATLAAGIIFLLTGATTAIYLHQRENPAAANNDNITSLNPDSRQAAGEVGGSRSVSSRKREPDENPELVAKYSASRTSLSRIISRDLVGILESQIKDSEESLADIRDDDSNSLGLRFAIGSDLMYLDLSDAQIEVVKKPYLDHAKLMLARDKAIVEGLKEDPSVLMEYLLASDATARGTGDPSELAAMQKRINDTMMAGSDDIGEIMEALEIVTLPSRLLANLGLVTALKPLLEPNQVEKLDARLEKLGSEISSPPKAIELDNMHLAVSSMVKLTYNAKKILKEMEADFKKFEEKLEEMSDHFE